MAFDIGELLRPGKVAVVLSEVQRNIIGDLTDSLLAQVAKDCGVTENSARLAKAARERGAPVVHCLANTNPGRFGGNTNARLFNAKRRDPAAPPYDPASDAPCPEVFEPGDVVSLRDHGLNPMADTQLDRRLRNAGIDTLIVTGVSLNVAILGLVIRAVDSGYQVIVARDAVSGYPKEYHEPVLANTLFMIATLATTEEIVAAWAKGAQA